MKRILLFTFLIPFLGFSQNTTTQNGDFYNPLIWDCFCIPTNGDNLIINHDVNLNLDIYYNTGSITVNASGSLIQDATDRNFWADGTATMTNHGTFTVHAIYLSPGASLTNTGNLASIDSLWNQGTFANNGVATMNDIWNDQTGSFTNSGNLANADSLLNQGTFLNQGTAVVYDFGNDEMASFTNTDDLMITNNMNNQGYAFNSGNIDLENDFSNCNTQNLDAMLINDGIFCIANDFLNCVDDTLTGSGNYYIGGLGSNLGVFEGTHTFHTPSGTLAIPGNISPTVTITTGACDLSVLPLGANELSIYPNPTSSSVVVNKNNVAYEVYDVSGRLMLSGRIENSSIDFSTLNEGIYTIKVGAAKAQRVVKL